jgi:ribonuclease P protein component
VVIREGKRIRTRHLDVRVLASPLGHPRVGLVVPRFKRSAVDRNRLKRQLRELARLVLLPTAPSADVVIRVRPESYGATFETLHREVESVRARL